MRLNSKKTILLGIVNATPDSFSDGGKDDPAEHASMLIRQGADAIDIGGESTRPGAAEVSADEELSRVMPVLLKIRRLFPDIIISIDTRKASVAEETLKAGANWINDVSGGTFQPQIMSVAARYNSTYIIGHTRGTPQNMLEERFTAYPDGVFAHVLRFWQEAAAKALSAGVSADKIMVDPGFGFAKNQETNQEMAENFHKFIVSQPYPVWAGVSRKRFLAPELSPAERGTLSSMLEVKLAAAGAAVIRTHDPAGFLKYTETAGRN